MPQTMIELGGKGAPMHIAVANGFPPQTYLPLLRPFADRYHLFSLPPRPLWADPPPPESIRSWSDLATDLVASLAAHGLRDVVAVGHSFGAMVSMTAAAQAPERFRALVLLDPTIFPPHLLYVIGALQTARMHGRLPRVKGALNRRARFASIDEAFLYWRGKRLFHDWSDDVLRLYTEHALTPSADGGYSLAWSPAWEARIFQTQMVSAWRIVERVRGRLPILTIRGGSSDTLMPAAAARLRRRLPDMTFAEIEGHGHLFPQSAPGATYEVMAQWLASH